MFQLIKPAHYLENNVMCLLSDDLYSSVKILDML